MLRIGKGMIKNRLSKKDSGERMALAWTHYSTTRV